MVRRSSLASLLPLAAYAIAAVITRLERLRAPTDADAGGSPPA